MLLRSTAGVSRGLWFSRRAASRLREVSNGVASEDGAATREPLRDASPRGSVVEIVNATPSKVEVETWPSGLLKSRTERWGCSLEAVETRVREAREAVAVAAEAESDDHDRDKSVALARRAIEKYEAYLASAVDGGNESAVTEARDSVGADVAALKNELFLSRKQRVWIAVHGWF